MSVKSLDGGVKSLGHEISSLGEGVKSLGGGVKSLGHEIISLGRGVKSLGGGVKSLGGREVSGWWSEVPECGSKVSGSRNRLPWW